MPQVERKLNEATAAQEAEAKAHNAKIDAQVAELDAKAKSLKTTFADRLFDDRLAKLPEPIREDTRKALATEAAKRTEVQKYLAGKFAAILNPPEAKLPAILAVDVSRLQDADPRRSRRPSPPLQARKTDIPRNPRLLRPAG